MIRNFVPLLAIFLGACATNTTTTKYTGTDPKTGAKVVIELPKDTRAKGIDIRTASGARIKIDELQTSVNPEVTKAQAAREQGNIKAASGVIEKGVEGAAKGIVKGIKGF